MKLVASSFCIPSLTAKEREQLDKLRATIPPAHSEGPTPSSGEEEPTRYPPIFGGVFFRGIEEAQTKLDTYSKVMKGVSPSWPDSFLLSSPGELEPRWNTFLKGMSEFAMGKICPEGPLDPAADILGNVLDIGALLGENNKWKKMQAAAHLTNSARKRVQEELVKHPAAMKTALAHLHNVPALVNTSIPISSLMHPAHGLETTVVHGLHGLFGPHGQNIGALAQQFASVLAHHPVATIAIAVVGTAAATVLVAGAVQGNPLAGSTR